MHLAEIELRHVALPLIEPWVTATGVMTRREMVVVRVADDGFEGWGECVALNEPGYSDECAAGALEVLDLVIAPIALASGDLTADAVADALAAITGHRMAKAAVEMAVLDLEGRRDDRSLATRLGGTRAMVDAGVAIGLHATIDELCARVTRFVAEGYRRVKVKIEHGRDIEWVAAVRAEFPTLALQVDANGAYELADADHLTLLDEFGLLLIEQPLADDDLTGHAALAERLATPICLDESLISLDATRHALALGACSIVNLKPGRVGGLLEAVRIHDHCRDAAVPLWCGGMLESGIGRAANVALASLPGFTLPGDLSASARFYERDLILEPFTLIDGRLAVPTGAGLGVEIDRDALDNMTIEARVRRPS